MIIFYLEAEIIDREAIEKYDAVLCLKMGIHFFHSLYSNNKIESIFFQFSSECNVLPKKISRRRIRFLQDIFTTLVDSQWRWTLIVFALSFILSWLFFAVIWWLIAVTHGDLEEMHLPPHQGIMFVLSVNQI